jgi:protease I
MTRVLILLADGFDDLSLILPWFRLREIPVQITLAAPMLETVTGVDGYAVRPDWAIADVTPTDIDLLLIPGGAEMTETLRLREDALDITRTLATEGHVAAIGHGAQVLMSAGAIDGRTLTASPGIRDDIRAAGGLYKDEPAIADGNLLTARSVDDLPEFHRRLAALIASWQGS